MRVVTADVVVDLGFGDSGKGQTVHELCSNSVSTLVVRYTGGPQAGHTVRWTRQATNTTESKHAHVFSSFGSGTVQGVPSYFSRHTSIYLPALIRERDVLHGKEVYPILYVDPLATFITPYDVAWNRACAITTGHGSCGHGVGAAMARQEQSTWKLYAGDMLHPKQLAWKMSQIKDYYVGRVSCANAGFRAHYEAEAERAVGDFHDYWHNWDCSNWDRGDFRGCGTEWFEIATLDQVLAELDPEHVVLEGAQGVMLDRDHGCFPYVTYGYTTSRNAFELIGGPLLGPVDEVRVTYLSRCYQTRHGPGPMTGKDLDQPLVGAEDETNVHNRWQGAFRLAKLDPALLNQAVQIDRGYHTFPVEEERLILTCASHIPDFHCRGLEIAGLKPELRQ